MGKEGADIIFTISLTVQPWRMLFLRRKSCCRCSRRVDFLQLRKLIVSMELRKLYRRWNWWWTRVRMGEKTFCVYFPNFSVFNAVLLIFLEFNRSWLTIDGGIWGGHRAHVPPLKTPSLSWKWKEFFPPTPGQKITVWIRTWFPVKYVSKLPEYNEKKTRVL